MRKVLITLALCAVTLCAVTVQGSLDVLGTLTAAIVNFGSATSTAPNKVGTSLPGTCTVGQTYFKSDATAGANIYACTSTNTWTAPSGGGGGTSYSAADRTFFALREDFGTGNVASGSTTSGSSQLRTVPIGAGNTDVVATSADLVRHPGIMRLVTGATAGNGMWIGFAFVGSATSQSVVNWSDLYSRNWDYVAVIKPGSAADVRLRAGITNSISIAGSTGSASMWIRYDTNASYNDGAKASGSGAFVAQICGYDDANCSGDTTGLTATLAGTVGTDWTILAISNSGGVISFHVENQNPTTGAVTVSASKTACLAATATCDMVLPTNPGYGLTTYSGTPSVVWGTNTTAAKTALVDLVAFHMGGMTR